MKPTLTVRYQCETDYPHSKACCGRDRQKLLPSFRGGAYVLSFVNDSDDVLR